MKELDFGGNSKGISPGCCRCSRSSFEVDQGGRKTMKTAAPKSEDVEAGVVLELLWIVLDVEDEEGVT